MKTERLKDTQWLQLLNMFLENREPFFEQNVRQQINKEQY